MRHTIITTILPLFIALAGCGNGCGKSNINTNCVTNGLGDGHCTFTNRGTAAGSMCLHIEVWQKKGIGTKRAQSPTICSGQVAENSTTKVEFTIVEMRDMCSATKYSKEGWGDVCAWEISDDTK